MERQLVQNIGFFLFKNAILQENAARLLLWTQSGLPMPTDNMPRKMKLAKKWLEVTIHIYVVTRFKEREIKVFGFFLKL